MMSRTIQIRFRVPWTLNGVRVACGALTALNRLLLREAKRRGRPFPALYDSGVRYERQEHPSVGISVENFDSIPSVLARLAGDCDQLAAWRAAELQERGVKARAVPTLIRSRLMHVIVVYPDGSKEDPSKRLGMKGRGQ